MATQTIDYAELSRPGVTTPFPSKDTQRVDHSAPTPTVLSDVARPRKVSARAKRILFGVMTDPRLRLRRALSVKILRKSGAVVAHVKELGEFGHGVTMSGALDDLSKSLAELYFALKHESDRLSEDLVRRRQQLQVYIEERPSR